MEKQETKPKKVMVVDDDADFVEIEKTILEAEGYDVVVAYNGSECLKKVKQDKPDLIILDIQMTTEYDGVNTAQYLRDHEELSDIPIIVVTSKPIYSIYPDDEWYPTDEFINKPVDKEQFISQVKRVMGI